LSLCESGWSRKLYLLEQIRDRAQALGEGLAGPSELAVKGVLDRVAILDSMTGG